MKLNVLPVTTPANPYPSLTWITVRQCVSCTIAGNDMLGGLYAVSVNGSSGAIRQNHMVNLGNTSPGLGEVAMVIGGSNMVVSGNLFDERRGSPPSAALLTDVSVTGTGHRLESNTHLRQSTWLSLAYQSTGTIVYPNVDKQTLDQEVSDLSAQDTTVSPPPPPVGRGWKKITRKVLALDSDPDRVSRIQVDADLGGTLQVENSGGQNASLVLDDPVAGGAYGRIQINKVGGPTVNIAGGALAGPTFFNAGDNVGIGTSAPGSKLEVAGGDAFLSTAGARDRGPSHERRLLPDRDRSQRAGQPGGHAARQLPVAVAGGSVRR
jgi:hypothetical protein